MVALILHGMIQNTQMTKACFEEVYAFVTRARSGHCISKFNCVCNFLTQISNDC